MSRTSLVFTLTVALALTTVVSPAHATTLMSAAGQRFDIQDGIGGAFSTDGSMSDGTADSYDGCYYLTVGGSNYFGGMGMATLSLDGRQTDMPPAPVGDGLMAERHIYVPATGPSFARYVDVISNPMGSDVMTTVTINGNLGSDGSTVLVTTSSGDMAIAADDSWFATDDIDAMWDPSLAHVFQGLGATVSASSISPTGSGGSDNVSYSFVVTVPAGGRIAIMHFAVQEMNQATAIASAQYIAELSDDVIAGLDEFLGDVVNWPVSSSGACTGTPDGASCSSSRGDPGTCHASRCCTGCWDGAVCRSGRSASACAVGGAACVTCAAVAFCSSASCEAGICTGSPCDDGETCTTDSCDEAADRCNHAVTSGCIVGGECVTEGDHHIAYPCLVCDSSRNATDWSPVASGASCGSDRCNLGRLFQGGTCDGAGECVAPRVEICETEECADTTTCGTPCTATSCGPSERCATSLRCEALHGLGEACTADDECLMGSCVDGVCCSAACDGVCESCALPGSEGTCSQIASGTDPYAECPGARVCNGAGACGVVGEDAGRPDTGVMPDAGMRSDAAVDAAMTADGGTTPEPDRGCSCAAAGAGTSTPSAAGFALLIGAVLLRRRRARA
jgi:MYXO-CTERM domain-containing protein